MSSWLDDDDTKKIKRTLFRIGEICTIDVPSKYMKSHGIFDEATVEVVSRADYKSKYPSIEVNIAKIVVKFLDAPKATKDVTIVGISYPVRRSWLNPTGQHKCSCDLKTILMVSGCKCGGF